MPYSPGVVDRSGEIFGGYLTRGLTGLADTITKINQDYERDNANGKIADQIVKVNPELLQSMGMTPAQFTGMAAKDKHLAVLGHIQGTAMKQGAAQAAAALAHQQASTQDLLAQGQERTQSASQDAALGDAINRMAQASGQQKVAGQAGQVTADSVNQFAGTGMPGMQPPPGISPESFAPQQLAGAPLADAVDRMVQGDPSLAALSTRGIGGRNAMRLLAETDRMQQLGTKVGSVPMVHDLPGGYVGFTLPGTKNFEVKPKLDGPQEIVINGHHYSSDGKGGWKPLSEPKPPSQGLEDQRAMKAAAERFKLLQGIDTEMGYAQRKLDANATEQDPKKKLSPAAVAGHKATIAAHSKFKDMINSSSFGAAPKRVQVRGQDGKIYTVPEDQLDEAQTKGFVPIDQN